jgi:hypothetical protein
VAPVSSPQSLELDNLSRDFGLNGRSVGHDINTKNTDGSATFKGEK